MKLRSSYLPVESVHGVDGVVSMSKVDKGVVSDLLHSLYCTCTDTMILTKVHLSQVCSFLHLSHLS